MNDFLRMCLNIIIQIGPYLVVLLLLTYIVNLQQKRAKEREEEQKKGIIRKHYIIKTEKVLTIFFVFAVLLFGGSYGSQCYSSLKMACFLLYNVVS